MDQPGPPLPARGYFAIGAERISKALNLGNLMRSAHGFGASFTFTIGASYAALEARSDTSKSSQHLPHYNWRSVAELALPEGCRLVGVELLDRAIELPSFRHPLRAAYVLGPERGSLSAELVGRCDYLVRIPRGRAGRPPRPQHCAKAQPPKLRLSASLCANEHRRRPRHRAAFPPRHS
jgi:tRNA G18 (ribose-2'-O)-methylase SpoU